VSYLIDTNILIRVAYEGDSRHEKCAAAIDTLTENKESLYVCAQVLAEFWVVLTRPSAVNGCGLQFEEAATALADARASFKCLTEPPDMADRWQAVVRENQVMGKQAHDARLVALMLAHNVTRILTLNPSDFARYQGITAVTPEEALSSGAT